MKTKRIFGLILAGVAVMSLQVARETATAQVAASSAITGVVNSKEEGLMEGVLVSAKRIGSTVTITVVSDAQGRYAFPRNRLEAGQHSIHIRAVGYELDKPVQAQVMPEQPTQIDLRLVQTQDLSRQLSNGEWLMSMTGTREEKNLLLQCIICHTLEPVVKSRHDAAQFLQTMHRMNRYAMGTSLVHPQLAPSGAPGLVPVSEKRAEHAATINVSRSSSFPYALKTLSRPKGKGTRVIITEYDLPRPETMPHDAIADAYGHIWYSDFGSQYLGKLDTKTGKITEYPMPVMDPQKAKGSLDLGIDSQGHLWLANMYQDVIVRFDPKSEQFQTWKAPLRPGPPGRTPMVAPGNVHVDGKVWLAATPNNYQLDVKSGEYKVLDFKRDLPKDSPFANQTIGNYGVASDSKNNFFGMVLTGDIITMVDTKTLKAKIYTTPTPDSGPRRGHMDSQDRLWFGEFRGNRIGMFDPKTERFQEWEVPTPWTNPYDAVLDKQGNAWTGGMSNDLVVRLNTRTGEMTEYLLPRATNIRRVDVDNSTNPPTFWVGNNLEPILVKLEPLD